MPRSASAASADQRIGQVERKQPAVNREADREHQRQRDEKDRAPWPAGRATDGRRREWPTTRGTAARACPIASLRQQWRARSLVYLIIRGGHDQPRDDGADRRAGRGADRVRRHDAGRPLVDEREPASAATASARASRTRRSASAFSRAPGARLKARAPPRDRAPSARAPRRHRCRRSARRPASARPTGETTAPAADGRRGCRRRTRRPTSARRDRRRVRPARRERRGDEQHRPRHRRSDERDAQRRGGRTPADHAHAEWYTLAPWTPRHAGTSPASPSSPPPC